MHDTLVVMYGISDDSKVELPTDYQWPMKCKFCHHVDSRAQSSGVDSGKWALSGRLSPLMKTGQLHRQQTRTQRSMNSSKVIPSCAELKLHNWP